MRKGFTLVELLAVIAILAILVIIALPNVMGMFNQAKQNAFTTELKEVYKAAEQEWIMDSLSNTNEQVYSRCETCSGKSLKLSGRETLDYYVKVGKNGKVVEFYATDGTFQFRHEGELVIEDIKDVQIIAELTPSRIIEINNDSVISSNDFIHITTGCSFGKYLDETTNTCVACPINTYKDRIGNSSCTACPVSTCTPRGVTGATSVGQCSEACTGLITPVTPGGQVSY